MLILTHYNFARSIHRHVQKKYGFDLNLEMLQYGSIQPDLLWEYVNVPHFYQHSHLVFTEELTQLMNENKFSTVADFSRRLGVVLHFTADYLCYAHNYNEKKLPVLTHVNYEINLHKCFNRYKSKGIHTAAYKNPHGLIKDMRGIYLKNNEPNVEKDVDFITAASLRLTDMLVESVLLSTAGVA